MLDTIQAINRTAAFNRWAGFEVESAANGEAQLRMRWRASDMAQYAGFLHAGLIGAMLDTACGFAAATVAGHVLASHFSVNCMSPAVGQVFVARARVVKAGRKQVFATAELFGEDENGAQKLLATGSAILVPVTPAVPDAPKM